MIIILVSSSAHAKSTHVKTIFAGNSIIINFPDLSKNTYALIWNDVFHIKVLATEVPQTSSGNFQLTERQTSHAGLLNIHIVKEGRIIEKHQYLIEPNNQKRHVFSHTAQQTITNKEDSNHLYILEYDQYKNFIQKFKNNTINIFGPQSFKKSITANIKHYMGEYPLENFTSIGDYFIKSHNTELEEQVDSFTVLPSSTSSLDLIYEFLPSQLPKSKILRIHLSAMEDSSGNKCVNGTAVTITVHTETSQYQSQSYSDNGALSINMQLDDTETVKHITVSTGDYINKFPVEL